MKCELCDREVYDPSSTFCPEHSPSGQKFDNGKLRYSLIPPILLESVASVLTFGAIKYAPNSWQSVPNAQERYLDALYRHLEAYRSGIPTDTDSGLSHLAHAACNIAFLLHFEGDTCKKH